MLLKPLSYKEKHISARFISGVFKAECKTWKHHSDFLKLWYSFMINIYAITMDISLVIVRYIFQLPLKNTLCFRFSGCYFQIDVILGAMNFIINIVRADLIS